MPNSSCIILHNVYLFLIKTYMYLRFASMRSVSGRSDPYHFRPQLHVVCLRLVASPGNEVRWAQHEFVLSSPPGLLLVPRLF